MEFTPISTQEEYQQRFNQDLGDRLRKNEEKWQKKYEGYISPSDAEEQKKELQKQIDSLTAALDSANSKTAEFEKSISERDAKIKGYETNAVKHRIAHEQGLSYDAAAFLTGDDEESIKSSAEALKGLIGNRNVPEFRNEPSVPKGDPAKDAFRQMADTLFNG